jgi:hypothetical protein
MAKKDRDVIPNAVMCWEKEFLSIYMDYTYENCDGGRTRTYAPEGI